LRAISLYSFPVKAGSLAIKVVFLETTLGPHKETIYADFAPKPNEKGATEYMTWLEKQTDIL
jgi:hypothetical protein